MIVFFEDQSGSYLNNIAHTQLFEMITVQRLPDLHHISSKCCEHVVAYLFIVHIHHLVPITVVIVTIHQFVVLISNVAVAPVTELAQATVHAIGEKYNLVGILAIEQFAAVMDLQDANPTLVPQPQV